MSKLTNHKKRGPRRAPEAQLVETPTPPKPQPVRIGRAKGRPMLTWVGKRPLTRVTAFPAQLVERYEPSSPLKLDPEIWKDWPDKYSKGGLLFHGDNKEVLAHLLANGFRGKVNLIYIDPPFDSGADYVRKVSLRGPAGTAKIDSETYTLGEQIQYTDIWANDNYLQFMYERLLLLKELLSPEGSFYLHCDSRKSHLLRVVLDEIFGPDNFQSEIIWQSSDAQSSAHRYGPIHNTIFYYAASGRTWHSIRTPLSRATADSWYTHEEHIKEDIVNTLGIRLKKGTVRRFNMADLTARKRGGDTEGEWRGVRPPVGRYWAYSRENLNAIDRQGRIAFSSSGRPYLKRYLDESEGTPPQDVWTDISMLRGISAVEDSGYPTEKPELLLERMLQISSSSGDLVLDGFSGSGTTAVAAQRLGRRWIACDINKGAIQTTAKRLRQVIDEQRSRRSKAKATQGTLLDGSEINGKAREDSAPITPAQHTFTVWRVNDYDLQIQHNEAVNLACEHIGVQRTKADSFFDGTLGKKLVKIVPFNHPLTPLDLEAVRAELDARPEEDREITMVSLGIELAATRWLDDWNRLRKGKNAANRMDVIELRTDAKYGNFIRHQPAQAKVSVKRSRAKIRIAIEDFISPSILERLREQAGVVTPQVKDWRWLVDSVMIDSAYDGEVFNVVLADVPERKQDLVSGDYEIEAPLEATAIAVKITDMLGEEVMAVARV